MKNSTLSIKSPILLTLFLISSLGFSQSTATYDIVFTSIWNATDHGTLPDNAHWSKLVGVNHNSNVSFFELGTMASSGIEMIAENGDNDIFRDIEVENAINSRNAEQYIDGPNLSTATGTMSIIGVNVSEEFPLLSIFSMIAPSPDWLIAIDDLNLLDSSGNWKTSISIPVLYTYDAGTDSGANYTSGDADSNLPISIFDSSNPIPPFNGNQIGYLNITLTNVLGVNETGALNTVKLFPNPTQGNLNISNSRTLKTIEIYNVLGSLVKRVDVENKTNLKLDLNTLNNGVYLVRMQDINGQTKTQKLILE